MTIEVKHATQAVGIDAGNGEIAKAQWNESHTINMASNTLLGRSSAGAGAAEEIAIGAGLLLSSGTLSGYVDADVDAHLNTATATTGQVLSWTGSDYDWVDQGGAVNGVFYENDQTVNTSYTITTNKNAMSAGPITIASGVTVTIPSGSSWAIV